MYFNTDDMEMYAGEDWFGNLKFVDKYCYEPLFEATQELEKDWLNAFGYRADDIQDQAKTVTASLVDTYNKDVREELKRKIAML